MLGEAVLLEIRGPIAIVSLNRPEKLNAVDLAILRGLRAALAEIEANLECRVVVVRGEGRAFCAGADLAMVDELVGDPNGFAGFMDEWHATYEQIAAFSLPTIAAVHGVALAGGFELLQVCDLAVVAEDARIGDQHATYGLFPGGGSTQRLPRLIPTRRALWLLLSGEWIDGATAVEWGLANRSAPAGDVLEIALEMAAVLAARSPAGSAAIKGAVAAGRGRPLDDALRLDRSFALEHMASEDAKVGLEAFRSRSQPVFRRT